MQENQKSTGLGDDIEKVAHALKLDKVADKVAKLVGKEDCGCKKRKDTLNKLFPHNSQSK